MTITICSSANFYKQVVDIQSRLQELGFEAFIPFTAKRMQESGDYDVSHYKTWYEDDAEYHKKTKLMLGHFDEIAKGDAILVANYDKHGVPNYIGGNVLMEMALALYLKKRFIYSMTFHQSRHSWKKYVACSQLCCMVICSL